jgi:hypothetical protein
MVCQYPDLLMVCPFSSTAIPLSFTAAKGPDKHQQCWECYLGDFTLSSAAFTPQSFPSARNHRLDVLQHTWHPLLEGWDLDRTAGLRRIPGTERWVVVGDDASRRGGVAAVWPRSGVAMLFGGQVSSSTVTYIKSAKKEESPTELPVYDPTHSCIHLCDTSDVYYVEVPDT